MSVNTTTKRRFAPVVWGAALWMVATLPAAAGVRYSAVTEESDGDRGAVAVESEGEGTRIEFVPGPGRKGGGGPFGAGDVLVSADGGATVYWVETRKRRYSQVDLARLAAFVGRAMQGVPGLFGIDVEEPTVEKLFEADGPALLGHPTRHARYLVTWRDRSRLTLPSRRGASSTVESTWHQRVQDVWTTAAVAAPAHDVWLRDRFRSGYEDLDWRLAAQTGGIDGFPLRVETVEVAASRRLEKSRVRLTRDGSSVTREFFLGDAGKREIDYRSATTEVTALEITAEPIAAEHFQPPADFSER